jgi:hypothetical protein
MIYGITPRFISQQVFTKTYSSFLPILFSKGKEFHSHILIFTLWLIPSFHRKFSWIRGVFFCRSLNKRFRYLLTKWGFKTIITYFPFIYRAMPSANSLSSFCLNSWRNTLTSLWTLIWNWIPWFYSFLIS